MDKAEMTAMIDHLKQVFDIVRLVNPSITTQFNLDKDGNLVPEPYQCYAVWKKTKRCGNCISARAAACKKTTSKFEFVDHSIYYVISKYVELDGAPYTLEMVSRIDDSNTLLDAYGRTEFIKAISEHNEKIYVDSLTGAYNRRYYDEQLQYQILNGALAIVDVDNFKTVNDVYGHLTGDKALQAVSWTLRHSVRDIDSVVRYGGDEFLILLQDFPPELLQEKLDRVRSSISEICLEELQGGQITVSIGGVCWRGAANEALESADKMLYRAKERKNTVVVLEQEAVPPA